MPPPRSRWMPRCVRGLVEGPRIEETRTLSSREDDHYRGEQMQWMWALLGVPASIAGFVIAHRINKRKPGTDTRGLYITMWLMILAVSASIFLAVA